MMLFFIDVSIQSLSRRLNKFKEIIRLIEFFSGTQGSSIHGTEIQDRNDSEHRSI